MWNRIVLSDKTWAISGVQRFGGIPVTGQLDQATLQLMTTPRCGNPDGGEVSIGSRKRRKRYVIGGEGWKRRNLSFQ